MFTGQGDPGRVFEFKEGVARPPAVLSGATLALGQGGGADSVREVFDDDPDEAELEEIAIAPPNLHALLGMRRLASRRDCPVTPQASYRGQPMPLAVTRGRSCIVRLRDLHVSSHRFVKCEGHPRHAELPYSLKW